MVRKYDDYDVIFTRGLIMLFSSCIVAGLYNIIIEGSAVGYGLMSSHIMVIGVTLSILYFIVAAQLKKYQLRGVKMLPRMKLKLKIVFYLAIGDVDRANEYHLLLEV